MARKGENIRHRKDGRWEGRYPAWDNKTGKHVMKSVYARTYTEVKEKLALAKAAEQKRSITQEKTEDTCIYTSDITISVIAHNWLESIAESHKHSTCVKYSQVYEKHLADLVGSLLISDIGMVKIEALLNRIEVQSRSLVNSIYSVVNQILKYAHNNYGTEYLRVTAPDEHKKAKPIEVLKRAEQSSLLKELRRGMKEETFFYKLGILICLYTGLRIGEICALKWADIDLVYGLLYVRRTVQRIRVDGQKTKTMLVEGEPKSMTSKREIPLADDIKALLGEISADNSQDVYIISRNRSTEPRTMYNHYLKCLENAGISQKTFHCLRHTFATNCINAEVDPKSLSEILGHSDVTITLNRYVHPSIDTKRRYMNTLSSIMGQLDGQNKREIA